MLACWKFIPLRAAQNIRNMVKKDPKNKWAFVRHVKAKATCRCCKGTLHRGEEAIYVPKYSFRLNAPLTLNIKGIQDLYIEYRVSPIYVHAECPSVMPAKLPSKGQMSLFAK